MTQESTLKLRVPVEGTNDEIEIELELKELADLIASNLCKRDLDYFKVCLGFATVDKAQKAYDEYVAKKAVDDNSEEKQ